MQADGWQPRVAAQRAAHRWQARTSDSQRAEATRGVSIRASSRVRGNMPATLTPTITLRKGLHILLFPLPPLDVPAPRAGALRVAAPADSAMTPWRADEDRLATDLDAALDIAASTGALGGERRGCGCHAGQLAACIRPRKSRGGNFPNIFGEDGEGRVSGLARMGPAAVAPSLPPRRCAHSRIPQAESCMHRSDPRFT